MSTASVDCHALCSYLLKTDSSYDASSTGYGYGHGYDAPTYPEETATTTAEPGYYKSSGGSYGYKKRRSSSGVGKKRLGAGH